MWMYRTIKPLLTSAAFSLALITSLGSASVAASQAVDFTLPGNTKTITLSDYKGQVVYVDFWASWCGPCRKSFPWMDRLHSSHSANGLKVIAVNLDADKTDAEDFLSSTAPQFAIAFDPDGKVAQAWNVMGMPSSYIIDQDGNVSYAHIGFRSKDKAGIEARITQLLESR